MNKLTVWSVVLSLFCLISTVAVAAEIPAVTPVSGNLEAIKIELPKEFFGGTPIDYWSANLEPDENWKERAPFLAPPGTTVISASKPVSSSAKFPNLGEIKMLVDNDKSYAKNSLVELLEGVQWVQIDLQAKAQIYALLVWHFHEGKRVYFDVIVQISNDPEFKSGTTTIYNNDADNSTGLGVGKDMEYVESYKGRLMDAKGVSGRYIRLYTNGNSADDKNHYVEVEVFGQVAK